MVNNMETFKSLAEAFPEEQARLRTILQHAQEIGPAGGFISLIILDLLGRADKAVMEQDTVAMVQIYQEMEDIQE
jgi:SAM-dependent MidA family methyltransferase